VLGLIAGLDAARARRTQADQVARVRRGAPAPGDVVVYCPDQLSPAVQRLLDGQTRSSLGQVTVPAGDLGRVDWINYERRISAVRSATVAARALARAGGGDVWVLTSPRYRTHQRTCADLRRSLVNLGARPRVLVPLDHSAYEYAQLERFTSRSAERGVLGSR
jgi:mannosyltransferase